MNCRVIFSTRSEVFLHLIFQTLKKGIFDLKRSDFIDF